MLLGDLIRKLEDEDTALEVLLATGDVGLVADVRRRAEEAGEPVGTLIGELVGTFASRATSDDWMALVTAASRSENPGGACLRIIIERSIDL